ncbi:MAG: SMC family ATPase, partial [Candidatus Micrarchaeota archaeon]|nr:SMC family ATPase [Candidatus Micrarchaeota archaeon]
MRLEFLELNNIRTYGHAAVNFQNGVTLFEGDVGCGKSTLLYAIEFALFGLSDLKAGHLLAHGADSGSVKLKLDVAGKSVTVFRELARKKDAARQSPGWIEENGVRTDFSPEELKAKMLSILGFRENPSSRAASWIFRYAVFTPQEQMKEILNLRPEERLQTLRKAFGVEEYKTARENAGVVQQRLRENAREMRGQILDVPNLQE